ncbi:hypothetical protein KR222_009770, partial [Zaprionus bogoriensis]
KEAKRQFLLFVFTSTIVLGCLAFAVYFAGINHEDEHLKHMLITFFVIFCIQFIFTEPIRYIVVAIDEATWPPSYPTKHKEESERHYNHLEFLKQRLHSMRVQIVITERYRHESINMRYKNITLDLWNYGRFMIVFYGMVLVSRDELMFHNTEMATKLFTNNHTYHMGINELYDLNQLFDFVELTLIEAFDPVEHTESGPYAWIHSAGTKIVGVIRMRQLRLANDKLGWGGYPEFTNTNYMPGWILPYHRLHYAEKYWRTYEPWVSIEDRIELLDKLLLNFDHYGEFQHYPELKGYISLLTRTKGNSMKILDFLEENLWLNYNTSAVFFDFTLYNVDSDIFTVVNMRVERTPFGCIITNVECQSVRLIELLNKKPFKELIVMSLYSIVVVLLCQVFFMHVWYDPSKMRRLWYIVDLIIIILNLALISIFTVRAWLTTSMLKRLEGANKLEFLDFRRPARLHNMAQMVCGFLICLCTLRLWKIMQFATVFQLFTKTLNLAWNALATTILLIFIFLMAFGIAFTTINGSNSYHFLNLFHAIISCMLFSFGFSTEIDPKEVFHGGRFLGMIMYASLGFVVAVLLINVFMTIINDYFMSARTNRTEMEKREINYFEYLYVEFYSVFRWIGKLFKRNGYKRRNHTVADHIRKILDEQDRQHEMKKRKRRSVLAVGVKKALLKKDEEVQQAKYRERIEHILAISHIMKTQLNILEEMLFPEDDTKRRKRTLPVIIEQIRKPKDYDPD